jgi:hypothetical protein
MRHHPRVGQCGEGTALARGDVLAQHGQAADMCLINYRTVPGHAGRAVIAPVETVVHHDRLRHRRRAVPAVEGKVAAAGTEAVAEQRIGPAHLASQLPGVGVQQKLVRVEPMAVARLVRAMGTVAVEQPRAGLRQVAVPDLIGAFR